MINGIGNKNKQLQRAIGQLNVLKEVITRPNNELEKISLHTLYKIIITNISDIIRCKSDNNYTTFCFKNKEKLLVSKTLKFYADLLKEAGFLRVHQSHLINTKYIKEFIKSDGGYLILTDNCNVPVSVRKRNKVLEALNSF